MPVAVTQGTEPAGGLLVEHDHAELFYDRDSYCSTMPQIHPLESQVGVELLPRAQPTPSTSATDDHVPSMQLVGVLALCSTTQLRRTTHREDPPPQRCVFELRDAPIPWHSPTSSHAEAAARQGTRRSACYAEFKIK